MDCELLHHRFPLGHISNNWMGDRSFWACHGCIWYQPEQEESKYFRAQERVQNIKAFYARLVRSILIIVFLGALNYYLNEWRNMWFLWAALGIGISLAFKALKVFELNPFFDKNWEDRKIKEIMKEEQKRKWN